MGERYYTCSKCQKITTSPRKLDDKSICYSCLDEAIYGEERRRCKERGYHETNCTSGNCGSRENGDGTATFMVKIRCKCGEERSLTVSTRAEPIEPGSFIHGYPFPSGPKRWAIIGGEVTEIPDDWQPISAPPTT